MVLTHQSTNLYLYIIGIVPQPPDTLYALGYMIYGRKSIFVLASINIINSFGLCMIYFIVFGDTAGQLTASLVGGDAKLGSDWYTSRYCYSVPLALLLLPVILKKELAEFAWVSYVLFVSLALFLIFTFAMLVFDDNFAAVGYDSDLLTPKIEWGTFSALNVMMLAYAYQGNVLPIWSELKN